VGDNKDLTILLDTMDVHLLDNTQTSLVTLCVVISTPWWQQLASVAMMQCAQSSDCLTVISSVISL
jgi:hypothetical protein